MEHKFSGIRAKNPHSILTPSAAEIDFLAPDPEEILPSDMLRGMTNAHRFSNQADWTVTQHSLLVAYFAYRPPPRIVYPDRTLGWVSAETIKVLKLFYGEGSPDPTFVRRLLYHDAHEGYTGDLPKPLKIVLGDSIVQVEKRLDAAIEIRLDLKPVTEAEAACIKELDIAALDIERAFLGHPPADTDPVYRDLLDSWDEGRSFMGALQKLDDTHQKLLFLAMDLCLRTSSAEPMAPGKFLRKAVHKPDMILSQLLDNCLLCG